MRALVLLTLLAAQAAVAQDPAEPEAGCKVVSQPPDVNAEGRIERPPPTPEECSRAWTLEGKFLATRPNQFRLVRDLDRAPETVRRFIDGIAGLGEPRISGNVRVRRYPRQPDIVLWLSPELVVFAYRSAEFSGTATNVVLADLGSLSACTYLRWQGNELPAMLSIVEIQEALRADRLGNREAPDCHLGSLPLD